MKTFLVVFVTMIELTTSLSLGATQGKIQHNNNLRDKIRKDFNENFSKCIPSKIENGMSDFHKKPELWSVCAPKNGNRIIKIESHKKDTFYQEIYFEENGKLRYAKQIENFMPKNSFTQVYWNVEYFFENSEMIDMISVGHGKTEEPSWYPSIIKMYKNRIKEFKKMKSIS